MIKYILTSIVVLFSLHGFSLEYGCTVEPKNLNAYATEMVKSYADKDESLPDSMILNTEVNLQSDNNNEGDSTAINASVEGFFRPLQDEFYGVLPIPVLIQFEFLRSRDVIYICAHMDKDPEKQHMTIYFMKGHDLDKLSVKTLFSDIFHKPELEINSATPALLGLKKIIRPLDAVLNIIPVINVVKEIPRKVIESVNNTLGMILATPFGADIQRIVVTPKSIELSAGVNVNEPSKTRVTHIISLEEKDHDKKNKEEK